MPGKNKISAADAAANQRRRSSADLGLIDEALKLELIEERRQREEKQEAHKKKWIDSWDRNLEKEERLEDCKQCCAPDEFYPHPKTQSNVWIQINTEKTTQHVQMAFKKVPVPKPNPPPPPKLEVPEDPKNPLKEDKKSGDKKKGKKKDKKKK